jgi:hypothetical protein
MAANKTHMKQGILLVAIGHPYYGRMAYNLAVTLKACESEMPLAVITDRSALQHLSITQRALFDLEIPLDIDDGNFHKANEIRLDLPKHTPFKETLAIDVDMAWLHKKPSELFRLLGDRDFTAINEGYYDLDTDIDHTSGKYSFWADRQELKESYGLKGKLYQFRGEFTLFRKSAAVAKLYREAKKIFYNPKVATQFHGGTVTDEFCLNIAANLVGIQPHADCWQPTYWPGKNGWLLPTIPELMGQYYALSVGGNSATSKMKSAYGIITVAAANKLGLRQVFPLQAKRNYLTERIKS